MDSKEVRKLFEERLKCARDCEKTFKCDGLPEGSVEHGRCELLKSWCIHKECYFTFWDAIKNIEK